MMWGVTWGWVLMFLKWPGVGVGMEANWWVGWKNLGCRSMLEFVLVYFLMRMGW